ncbi:zinc finger protein 420-like [Kryptolebias marmoratus]|uniref:Zinc finger protein 420-like n=1 Tax=Kryptolebias marmoratus TaxID=37003 RepID=A0A3Q3AEE3_KRYMA|nr:zinc finger protein 420-like [Kryptolebias marmoratus]
MCSVIGCYSWRRGARRFALPADPEMRVEWVQFVFEVNNQRLRESSWTDIGVCCEHFTPDCFSDATGTDQLKSSAVPTISVRRVSRKSEPNQEAKGNPGAAVERDAPDSVVTENNQILQNIENLDIIKEKAALLQVTKRYVVNEKQLLRLFSSQCPLCQSRVKAEKVVCGVLFALNVRCPQCDYSKEWKNLSNVNVPAAGGTQPAERTETTLETVSSSSPELVYFVGEESDHVELSDDSSDPGDVDSDEDWDPEEELQLDEELQAESGGDTSGDDEDIVFEHKALCTDCGTFFNRRKPHTCEHKVKPFPCNICGRRFVDEVSLRVHARVHNGSYEVSCKYCHLKFHTKFDKAAHQQIHLTEKKPYKCPDCSETFAKYPEYRKHMEGHRGATQLRCHVCRVKFSDNSGLQRHLVVHTGEKPFKCAVCGRRFNQAGNLKSHMRLHTGEKPYRCQHCDQSFNHNVSLKSHVQRYHAAGCDSQPKKANRRKRDSGDSQHNGNETSADSWPEGAEQDSDCHVRAKETRRSKTKIKTTARPIGRPKKNTADGVSRAKGRRRRSSDTNAAKINKKRAVLEG